MTKTLEEWAVVLTALAQDAIGDATDWDDVQYRIGNVLAEVVADVRQGWVPAPEAQPEPNYGKLPIDFAQRLEQAYKEARQGMVPVEDVRPIIDECRNHAKNSSAHCGLCINLLTELKSKHPELFKSV